MNVTPDSSTIRRSGLALGGSDQLLAHDVRVVQVELARETDDDRAVALLGPGHRRLVQAPCLVHSLPPPLVLTRGPRRRRSCGIEPDTTIPGAMTSVEVPYSVACALPSLVVLDITNEIAREVQHAESSNGIAFVTAAENGLIRVNERESGFFADVRGAARAARAARRRGPGAAALVPARGADGAVAVRRRAALPRAMAAHPPVRFRRGLRA